MAPCHHVCSKSAGGLPVTGSLCKMNLSTQKPFHSTAALRLRRRWAPLSTRKWEKRSRTGGGVSGARATEPTLATPENRGAQPPLASQRTAWVQRREAAAAWATQGWEASRTPRRHRGWDPGSREVPDLREQTSIFRVKKMPWFPRTRASPGLKRPHRFTDSLTKEEPVLSVAWKLLHSLTSYASLLNE